MTYTYSTLFEDVIATMEEDSDEFVSALPSIISRAQTYLQRRVDPANLNRFTDVTVSAATRVVGLPADLLVLRAVQVSTGGGVVNLIQQTNEYLTQYWPVYTSVGTPKYFANKDNAEIFLAPTPMSATMATVEYVPRVTILSSTEPTNWFSTYADSAFFAACMMYANMWTKNGEASSRWKATADEELTTLNNEARRARRSDTSDRSQGTPENNLAEGAR